MMREKTRVNIKSGKKPAFGYFDNAIPWGAEGCMWAFGFFVGSAALAVIIVGSAAGQELSPYDAGRADRTAFEEWMSHQRGDTRAGAEFWAEQRSAPRPQPCDEQTSKSREWRVACAMARRLLAPADVRRRTEPDYRRGWNEGVASGSVGAPATASAGSPQPISPGSRPASPTTATGGAVGASASSRDPYEAAREYRDLWNSSVATLDVARTMALCGFRDLAWERRVRDRVYYVTREFASNSIAQSSNPQLLRRLVDSIWAEYMSLTGRVRTSGTSTGECLDVRANSEIARILDAAASAGGPAR